MSAATKPLEGVTVLEIGQFITGPYASLLLADLGANVIKIEKPGSGDPFRQFRSGTYSHTFIAFNRNKRSLTLDLTKPKAREVFLTAAARADVVIDNFRPGVMDKLGLGYKVLEAANPRLVVCSIAGFASDGPYRDRPSYDTVGQALSGMLSTLVDPKDPKISGPTISDNVTGFYASHAVLGALYGRQKTGRGAYLEIAMLEASMAFMPDMFTTYTQAGSVSGPQTRASFSHSFAFPCASGGMLAVHLSSLEKFWTGLLDVVGRPDLATDPRFISRPARIDNFEALIRTLRPLFAAKSRDHWMEELRKKDVPHAPVHTIPEAMQDPEVKHLGLFHTMKHPEHGDVTIQHRPVRINGEREENPILPPTLGEHTDSILASLGYNATDIAAMHAEKIV